MKIIKENWKFFLFIILICVIGGYYTTLYSFESVDSKVLEDAIKQTGSKETLILISVIQISIYAVFFTSLGMILSDKVGLWKKFEKNKEAFKYLIIISIVGSLLISFGDYYIFGSLLKPIKDLYNSKPSLDYIISSFTYGGIFEEILMRLFFMSLIIWFISNLFYKKKEIPTWVFIASNIISALFFATAHLPNTQQLFGELNFILLLRCFLLNGAFGLAFGYLYRKYSIHYAMLAHFSIHLISKILWLLFI
ncbi:MAG: CPBP family intramembrane metalloprotease [Bacilli bacterium]|nr:CPBP family intramembrane metalloprotease [Bacilli bacterium]